MKKEELKELLRLSRACPYARRKFRESGMIPSKFWRNIHPAWMIWFLQIASIALPSHLERHYKSIRFPQYGYGQPGYPSVDGPLFIKNWDKKEAETIKKRLLKDFPWKDIEPEARETLEQCRKS